MKVTVIENIEVAPRTMKLSLNAPDIASSAQPGQFVHLLCSEDGSRDPLLRRPLSIHNVDCSSGTLNLLYEIKGLGTELLSRKSVGSVLDILGPLGKGFDLPKSKSARALVVGGGMGLAPLVFLANELVSIIGCERLTVHMGSRDESALVCREDFEQMYAETRAATEDGSYGETGYVTGLVEAYLSAIDPADPPLIYACGPVPMLRAVAKLVSRHGLDCQVSLEAKMACGVGACMGCAVKVRSADSTGYVRACSEGPVFRASEVIWD